MPQSHSSRRVTLPPRPRCRRRARRDGDDANCAAGTRPNPIRSHQLDPGAKGVLGGDTGEKELTLTFAAAPSADPARMATRGANCRRRRDQEDLDAAAALLLLGGVDKGDDHHTKQTVLLSTSYLGPLRWSCKLSSF